MMLNRENICRSSSYINSKLEQKCKVYLVQVRTNIQSLFATETSCLAKLITAYSLENILIIIQLTLKRYFPNTISLLQDIGKFRNFRITCANLW